jgi:hypothetical protein
MTMRFTLALVAASALSIGCSGSAPEGLIGPAPDEINATPGAPAGTTPPTGGTTPSTPTTPTTPKTPGTDPVAACPQSGQLEARAVDVEFIVDATGSMAGAKWSAVTAGFVAFVDQVAVAKDARIRAGLVMFGDAQDPTQGAGPYPSAKDVPIASLSATQLAALKGRFAGTAPQSPYGIYLGLSGALAALQSVAVPVSSNGAPQKIAVLITDGDLPDNRPRSDFTSLLESKRTANPGAIKTGVLGIGGLNNNDYVSPENLGAMAMAGGVVPAGCSTTEKKNIQKMCHMHVEPQGKSAQALGQEVAGMFRAVRRMASGCVLDVPQAISKAPGDYRYTLTVEGGSKAQLKEGVDFAYDEVKNPSELVLLGDSCEQAKAKSIQVDYAPNCAK